VLWVFVPILIMRQPPQTGMGAIVVRGFVTKGRRTEERTGTDALVVNSPLEGRVLIRADRRRHPMIAPPIAEALCNGTWRAGIVGLLADNRDADQGQCAADDQDR
jgi:hypothetical protein